MRGRIAIPAINRFENLYIPVTESGCWIWMGALDWDGYGVFSDTPNGKRTISAHKWSYEYHKGKVPKGLQIDHLCRVRCCVNPSHLEAVTARENLIRGILPSTRKEFWASRKYCRNHKHEMNPENVVYDSEGIRRCKACMTASRKVSNFNRNKRRAIARLARISKG